MDLCTDRECHSAVLSDGYRRSVQDEIEAMTMGVDRYEREARFGIAGQNRRLRAVTRRDVGQMEMAVAV